MSVRSTTQTLTKYPTSTVEPETKSNTQPLPQHSEVSASPPRMDSRQSKTHIPRNPRNKGISKASSSALASTEPRQIATGASSKSSAEMVSFESEATTSAASKYITFNRDENFEKHLEKMTGPTSALKFCFEEKHHRSSVDQRVKKLAQSDQLFKKNAAQPLSRDHHLLMVGREYLEKMEGPKSTSGPSPKDIASCAWLIDATVCASDDTLKAFFELAIAFREKGIDLPSLIVNLAIDNNRHEFLTRLNHVYPNTNIAEYFVNKQ